MIVSFQSFFNIATFYNTVFVPLAKPQQPMVQKK